MPGPYSLIDLPAPLSARWVALALLKGASRAFRRFESGEEGAAVDLGVSLSRLQHWADTFRPHLGGSLRPRHLRRLERLESLGSASRDAANRLDCFRAQTASAHGETTTHDELTQLLTERLRIGEADFRQAVVQRFPRLRNALRRRLGSFPVPLRADRLASLPPFGDVLAGRAHDLLESLRSALAAPGAEDGRRAAESAQRSATRLRSVLEAVSTEIPALGSAAERLLPLGEPLDRLRTGNDLAAQLVEEKAGAADCDGRSDAIGTVLRALHRRQHLELAAIRRLVSPDELEELRVAIRGALAGSLPVPSGAADLEIERKFLLAGFPVLSSAGVEVLQVDQGWLPGTRLLERLRRVRTGCREEFFRTVKLGRGVSRLEVEETTQREVFEVMWPLTEGRRVRKTRYRVVVDGLTWEIDRFADLDLVLAEVEIPTADTAIRFPGWLEPHVVREVTDDAAYINFKLAC
jgi:CYTH domain-containing protein